MPSIKVLAISPYPGMVPLLTETAKEYDGLELTISVGDLAKGLELAQKGFHANFDVIISRGGTARLLKQSVSLPVIEIGTTVYDVLCTLQRANIHEGRVAIVGYSNITQDMGILRTLLPYQLDVFTIQSSSQAVTTLQYLRREEYASVLCDMVTYTAAKEMDVNAFLITSSAESIRAAFDQAVFFCSANRQLRSENQFLRQLLHKRTSQTVVFTRAGKLVFSTLEDASAELLDMLREKIESVAAAGRIKVMQQFRGLLYNIEAMQLPSDGEAYTAFYFLASTPPVAGDKYGISYYNCSQLEEACSAGIYNITGLTAQYHQSILQAAAGRAPVFLFGAAGTGKEYLARTIYLRSARRSHPFIQIDCNLLSRKTWNYLLGHHSSPLCDTENTLYFQNLNALDDTQWRQLLAFLLEGQTAKHNQLIFSRVEAGDGRISGAAMEFINRLSCFPLCLSSLHAQPAQVETAFSLYLDRHTIDTGRQWRGIDADALTLLRQYPWTQNYLQFHRVMERLTELCTDAQIRLSDVQAALQAELSLAPAGLPRRLSRPLPAAGPHRAGDRPNGTGKKRRQPKPCGAEPRHQPHHALADAEGIKKRHGTFAPCRFALSHAFTRARCPAHIPESYGRTKTRPRLPHCAHTLPRKPARRDSPG